MLVLGVGPLGLMHLAKAEMLGAGRLIAIDVLPERLEHARAFGADTALDASATTAEERRGQVREATGGLGADVVVDCSGRAETFPEALGLVRPGGTVVEAGAFDQPMGCVIKTANHEHRPAVTLISCQAAPA